MTISNNITNSNNITIGNNVPISNNASISNNVTNGDHCDEPETSNRNNVPNRNNVSNRDNVPNRNNVSNKDRGNEPETSNRDNANVTTFQCLPEEIQEMILLYHHRNNKIRTSELLEYAKTCRTWRTIIHDYLSKLHPVYDYLLNENRKISQKLNLHYEFVDRPKLIDLSRRIIRGRCERENNANKRNNEENYRVEAVRCYDNFTSNWTIDAKSHKELWRCSWTPYAQWNFVHSSYLVNNKTYYYHHHLLHFSSDFRHIKYGYQLDCLFIDRIFDTSILRVTRPVLKIIVWLNKSAELTVQREFVKITLFTRTGRTHDIDVRQHNFYRPIVVTLNDYPNDLSEIQVSNRYRINDNTMDKFLTDTNRQRYSSFNNMRTYVYFQRK